MPETTAKKPELTEVASAKTEPVPLRAKDKTINLTVPVQAHGEMVKKLTFRRPTGKDMMMAADGYPIHIDWNTGHVTPNNPVMGLMMSILAEVPPSTIGMMDGEDFATCAHALIPFFMPGNQAMQF